jgi:hypothetical protein
MFHIACCRVNDQRFLPCGVTSVIALPFMPATVAASTLTFPARNAIV